MATAIALLKKAAKQGHASALNALGCYYEDGTGVVADPVLAFEYCHKAALQGHRAAQFNVGDYHSKGYGCDKSEFLALEWLDKAAAQGLEQARDKAEELRRLWRK